MGRRSTSLNNYTNTAISREIASDYDNVELVADNIEDVKLIADLLGDPSIDLVAIGSLAADVTELKSAMTAAETAITGKANGVHTHVSTDVSDTASKRFVTDAEKAKWNALATNAELRDRSTHTGVQSLSTTTDSVDRFAMTPAERNKLAAIASEANKYVHPTKHNVEILDGTSHEGEYVRVDENGVVGWDYVNWGDISGKPVAYTPSAHTHSLDDVPTGNISATRVVPTETRQFVTAEQLATLVDVEVKSNRGVANGYVPLDSNGKINASFLNDLNLLDVHTPADQASMLLLNAQPGDIAYRLDSGNSYMLVALPATTLANWKALNSGPAVVSVNGMDGVVTLNTDDVEEGVSNLYYTNERVDDRVNGLLQAGTNVSFVYDDSANTLTINANDTSVNWSELQGKPTTVAGYAISDVYTKSETGAIVNAHTDRVDNPHSVTKAQVGLGSVDNTSDADKPISTAQATAINGLDSRLDTVESVVDAAHLGRADKWLAAQSVANMLYTDGKLSKVRYNVDTDTDYEVMTYASEKLSNVAHYTSAVLRGNTVLSYTDGKLVSAIYTGV